MIRLRTQITVAAALLATVVAPAAGPAAGAAEPTPAELSVTFAGGGWGHGVGMSQYGALGRAEAGQTAEQITGFYYQGTHLADAASLALDPAVVIDDVDVLVGTANCSTFRPSGEITIAIDGIAIDGVEIGRTSDPVAISRSGNNPYQWDVIAGPGARCNGTAAEASVTADAGAVDFCPGGCVSQPFPAPAWLTIAFTDGEPLSISGAWKPEGLPDRSYAHGQILLVPDGRPLPGRVAEQVSSRCGVPANDDFCIVVADMTMQQYLYGLAEVPATWHLEALRSQAIAGRSYALSRMSDRVTSSTWFEPFNLWASTTDQFYVGWDHESETCESCRWLEAVDLTNNVYVATSDNQITTTFYSSSNGGSTAANEDVWGDTPFSYLRSNPDPFDEHPSNPNGTWEHSYALADISRWLTEYPFADIDVGAVERITFADVPPSGRIDKARVTIHGSTRTLELTDSSGSLYGYRFWNAIRIGCKADNANGTPCSFPLTTKMKISSFFDVPAGQFYSEAIQWVADNNISTGVAPNLFAPFEPNSRSSVALFLWAFAGRPPAPLPSIFDDIAAGTTHEEAVSWLLTTGITTGTTPTTFSPESTVTRGQAAAFFWRLAGRPAPEVVQTFTDVDPTKYYSVPISWMVQWGITTGTSETTFHPERTLNRSEMTTFLWRLAGHPEAFATDTILPLSMR